jgi:nucleotide-binding universal stress UspA family protein
MTSLLLAYDGSESAKAAAVAAGALFPGAEAVVLTVGDAAETAAEGVQVATHAGLAATAHVADGEPWRVIRDAAAHVDVLVCGSRGRAAAARIALGSTSTALLHQSDRPLLVVQRAGGDGPVLVGYDGSEGAREAVAIAGRLLPGRSAVVVHVWESAIRHSFSGRALSHLPVDEVRGLADDFDAYYRAVASDVAEEGAALARESGLEATAAEAEAEGSPWHGLAREAERLGAAAVVVGARGRGALASTVLGSVSAGLAHNAALPVLVLR